MPQFLLRKFTDRGQLNRFDKITGRTKTNSPKAFGYEEFFYEDPDITQKAGSMNSVEKELGRLEGVWGAILKDVLLRVRTGASSILSSYEQHEFAIMLAIQGLRTRQFRDQVFQNAHRLRDELLKRGWNSEASLPKPDGAHARRVQLSMLLDPMMIDELCGVLLNHIWVYFRTVDYRVPKFYTSDSPLVRRGHETTLMRGGEGLNSRGVEIAFPLSPDVILVLFERAHHGHQHAAFEGMVRTTDQQLVDYYNFLQVERSRQWLFSLDKDFQFAKDCCEVYPELRNPNRPRGKIA